MNYRRIVPNSISSFSLILGILSMFKSVEGDFYYAAVFIILAMIADSMDGRAARLLGVSGEFGKELDSLCDLCSFGVAPAIMIYLYGMTDLGLTGQVIAALFTVGGAMRLARFNVNAAEVHGYFQGMPIPAGATCLATFVLSGMQLSSCYVAVLTLVVAVIMYSNIKFPDCKGKGNPLFLAPTVVGLVIGAAVLWQNLSAWMFVAMFTYTIVGIINWIYTLVMHK